MPCAPIHNCRDDNPHAPSPPAPHHSQTDEGRPGDAAARIFPPADSAIARSGLAQKMHVFVNVYIDVSDLALTVFTD